MRTLQVPTTDHKNDHLFFTGVAIAILMAVFAGFARTYYLKVYTGTPALPFSVHLHAVIFTSWVLLFLIQTFLVRTGNVPVHRTLGIFGAGLAMAMTVLGYQLAIAGARRGFRGQFPDEPGTPPDALAFMILGIVDLLLFLIFVAAGFYYRSRPDTHKRLMLLATLNVLPAAVSRIPIGAARLPVGLSLTLIFGILCPVYDRVVRGRMHPVSLWGGLVFLISGPLRVVVGSSDAWHRFARWLIG